MMNLRRSFPFARRQVTSRLRRGAVTLGALGALVAVTGAAIRHRASSGSYVFGGRIIAADSASLEGVRVVAMDARGSYEAVIDSSGMFVGAFSAPPVGRVTLRVFSDSAAPRYHTSVLALGPGVPNEPMRVVLLPMRWRIHGGEFDGREVRIDPIRATTRASDGIGYWRLTRRGRFAGRAVTWVSDSFPLRVAFRHERGDPSISTADSLRFWELAAELERRLGRSLFRPATFEEIDGGADGIFVTVDRRMSAAGKTFITYDQTGRIYEALVSVGQREFLGQSRIATHELMHAIGLGHTRGWSSVMGPSAEGVDSPSVDDVAYAQLYYAISRIQRERDAPFGILEAAR